MQEDARVLLSRNKSSLVMGLFKSLEERSGEMFTGLSDVNVPEEFRLYDSVALTEDF